MNEQGLQLEVEERDGLVVIVVSGYVDASNVDAFRSTLLRYAEREKLRLMLDCSGLHYLNSSGLGLLVGLQRKCAAQGGCAVLCNLATRIENTMVMIGLDRLLHRYPSRKEALVFLNKTVLGTDQRD